MRSLREAHKSDVAKLERIMLGRGNTAATTVKAQVTVKAKTSREEDGEVWRLRPIGHVRSWYKTKNGTPRQPNVCSDSKYAEPVSEGLGFS